jgi:phytoene synthase
MTPDEYCADKAAPNGSSFYYAFRLVAPERRRALVALHAFCREVDDAIDHITDPNVAHVKLAWWRGEIASTYDGKPHHPVTLALAPAIAQFRLPQPLLQTVVDGRQSDLSRAGFVDFAELLQYCHSVAGVVGTMTAEILGYEDPHTPGHVHDLAIAGKLAHIVRDVGEEARRGRIHMPQEDLRRFRVAPSDILRARHSDAFVELMRFEVGRALERYDDALTKLPRIDRHAQRAGIALAAIDRALLAEIARDGYRVLERRVALTPLRKLWIAWRSTLGA